MLLCRRGYVGSKAAWITKLECETSYKRRDKRCASGSANDSCPDYLVRRFANVVFVDLWCGGHESRMVTCAGLPMPPRGKEPSQHALVDYSGNTNSFCLPIEINLFLASVCSSKQQSMSRVPEFSIRRQPREEHRRYCCRYITK